MIQNLRKVIAVSLMTGLFELLQTVPAYVYDISWGEPGPFQHPSCMSSIIGIANWDNGNVIVYPRLINDCDTDFRILSCEVFHKGVKVDGFAGKLSAGEKTSTSGHYFITPREHVEVTFRCEFQDL